MERQPGRSAAVAQFGRVGCLGASQSFCLRRQASWLKVWRGGGCKLLNCTTDDVAILVSAGKLRALGRPKPNAVKFFSSIELITLLADPDWLDEATKTIGQYWRQKNARRNGLVLENPADDKSADAKIPTLEDYEQRAT